MTPAQTRLWPHVTGSRVWPRKIPDGPVVKTSPFSAGNEGLIPGQRAKIPHASGLKPSRNIKQKQFCNKFNKGFKNSPHLKKRKKIL